MLITVSLYFLSQGEKEKNLVDVHNFRLTLPSLQYQSRTWTWLDLMMAVKKDYKQVLVGQVWLLFLCPTWLLRGIRRHKQNMDIIGCSPISNRGHSYSII